MLITLFNSLIIFSLLFNKLFFYMNLFLTITFIFLFSKILLNLNKFIIDRFNFFIFKSIRY
jgi:hypothetical protein